VSTPAEITRRDDGLALRALRVGVAPSALIVHLGTDVVVRTPSRPDHLDGNVVDLIAPPDPSAVTALLERVRRLMEPVGVAHVQVRFEQPVDAPLDATLRAALVDAGCHVDAERVLELRATVEVPGMALEVRRLTLPTGGASSAGGDDAADDVAEDAALDAVTERRWHAAAVLDRYASGEDVPTWRMWDEEGAAWNRRRIRELAMLGRADVWLASRQGMPVASLVVLRDLDGVAVVEDVVVHPAHRRRGIGRTLLCAALAHQQQARPDERVLLAADPRGVAIGLYTSLGFVAIADVWTAIRAPRSSTEGAADAHG
jgi:ribosomal protein S18 acetylase RimI-like enzyme